MLVLSSANWMLNISTVSIYLAIFLVMVIDGIQIINLVFGDHFFKQFLLLFGTNAVFMFIFYSGKVNQISAAYRSFAVIGVIIALLMFSLYRIRRDAF